VYKWEEIRQFDLTKLQDSRSVSSTVSTNYQRLRISTEPDSPFHRWSTT